MTRLLAPRYWGWHLLALAAVGVTVALGIWQWGVWESHRAAAAQGLSHASPVPLATQMGGDSAFPRSGVGKPVRLTGRWLPQTFFVDKRADLGGYWVVQPVLVDGTRSAIPVVRGVSRTPRAVAATGPTTVSGWLEPSETSGLIDTVHTDDILPELNIAALTAKVPVDLYSGTVISRTAPSGLQAARPTAIPGVGWSTSLRNFLYAFQWWIFAGLWIYIWGRWCYDQLHPVEEVEASDVGSESGSEEPGAGGQTSSG